jgi:hypothetical protein
VAGLSSVLCLRYPSILTVPQIRSFANFCHARPPISQACSAPKLKNTSAKEK